mgnify:CR=1 FL=1
MNRNRIVKFGAIVMIFSLLITIFVGAMSVMASPLSGGANVAETGISQAHQGPSPDIDGDVSGGGAYTHMTMFAENTDGMYNLFRMSSKAWLDGWRSAKCGYDRARRQDAPRPEASPNA